MTENEFADSDQHNRLVPSGGVIHLIRALEAEGVDHSSLKHALKVDFSKLTEQNSRIQAGKILEAYRLAMELEVPGNFWLTLGDSFSVHNWHLELSNWILTGKNFAEVMPKLHGLYRGESADTEASVVVDALHETGANREKWIKQAITPLDPDQKHFKSHAELSAATLVRGLKSLLGERDLQFRFFFSYKEPYYGDSYRKYLGEDVTFQAPRTEVHIPRDYFFRSFLSSDAVMHQHYEEQLAEFFEPQENLSLVARIEAILLDCHGNFPSLIQICDRLNVGERSLRRSLRDNGTSYRELLLNTKMKRAKYYLCYTKISIEEIAYRLDYSDYANFRRAFAVVHGQSPSEYRKQNTALRSR